MGASVLFAAAASAQPYSFTTFAGVSPRASVDGAGSAARFNNPIDVATDSNGNVYVADRGSHVVRKITPAGVVTTFAGLPDSAGSSDGTGSAARFNDPQGIATDSSGNVYVADSDNGTIRKITPAGVVSTFAGTAGTAGSADGTGAAARFSVPLGMATDGSGNLYVCDGNNHTIRKITPAGVVSTFAGTAGVIGSADGTGPAARFYNPHAVAIDGSGIIYVADMRNHTIRRITQAGVVTTFAGSAGQPGFANATGTAAQFGNPLGITTDGSNNVYVADYGNSVIRKITPAAVVTTFAGTPGINDSANGTGPAVRFDNLGGLSSDSSGNIYVAESGGAQVRKITPAAVATTFAGAVCYGTLDGTGASALFHFPYAVATDSSGNVYVADTFNSTIRKITPSGAVSTFAGSPGLSGSADGMGAAARFFFPGGVAVDSNGNVYVGDTANETIRKITPSGAVSTLAGSPQILGSTDGTGSAARFASPYAVATDGSGNVYVADSGNHTIRKITPAGVVSTFAGTAGALGSTDGTGAAARFNNPFGVAADSGGTVYVADSYNETIRKITPAGVVTTFAGTAGASGTADGTGAAARFSVCSGVAADNSGNVFVADSSSNTIRKITSGGVVTTIGGSPGAPNSGTDGTGSSARFQSPRNLAIDSSGNVFVADNYAIRKGFPGAAPPTIGQWFGPATIAQNVATTLSFTLSNPNTSTTLTGIAFTDSLPSGLVVSTPNGQSGSSCGGSIADTQGTSLISLSGGALAGQDRCTFSVSVTATTLGTKTNTTDAVTSVQAPTGEITSATLAVTAGVFGAPTNVVATATSATVVGVSWTASSGAVSYDIARSASGTANFLNIGTSATTSYNDTTASANTAYLYKVRAIDGSSNVSSYSNSDLATTVIFTDSPLVGGTNIVKAVHLTELRTAIQAVRTLAVLTAFTFTDPTITPGTTLVNALHLAELRSALDSARTNLSISAMSYTDPTISPGVTLVRAVHLMELRNGVK